GGGTSSAAWTFNGAVTISASGSLTVSGAATLSGQTNTNNLAIAGPKPWIDVTNPTYGATGNGITDDRAAIQVAINALSVSGGKVFFPCGSYLVKATITIPLNVDADIIGESQGCSKIIKDFDSTALFQSATSTYGTQSNLS